MSAAKGLKVVGYFDCPGGGQVVVRDGVAYIGHVKPPNGTTLVDVSDPANPRKLSEITVPEGTLSHKVRVDNGDHAGQSRNLSDRAQGSGLSRRPRNLRYRQTHGPAPYRLLADQRNAPVHVRRPLRLRLARTRWLSRQRRVDHRLPEAGPARRSRPLVDAGAMDRRRRETHLGRHRSSLPSSDARWKPPLCQLLARRLRHSRHRGHDQAKVHLRLGLESAISLADAYRASGAIPVARTSRHAGRR